MRKDLSDMSQYKAVIFDMDGVLINSEPLYHEADKRMFRELGMEMTEEDVRLLVGVNSITGARGIVARHPELRMSAEELDEIYRASLLNALKTNQDLTLIAGVRQWMEAFSMRGMKLALASSSTTPMVHYIAERFGLDKVMGCIVTGSMVTVAKPDPEIFLKAAAGIDVAPEACIVIEDSPSGIEAAHAAGMYCVAFTGANVHHLDNSKADMRVDRYDAKNLARVLAL